MAKGFTKVSNEIYERYGYGIKFHCWHYIEMTRDFQTNEPTVSINDLMVSCNASRRIARSVLLDYERDTGTRRAHHRAQPTPVPERVSATPGHSSGQDLGIAGGFGGVVTTLPLIQEEENTLDGPKKGPRKAPDYESIPENFRANFIAIGMSWGLVEFFKAYPQQKWGALQEVRDAWFRNGCEAESEEVLDGLARWKRDESFKESNGKFAPKAVNFIEEMRWKIPPAAKRLPDDDIKSKGIFLAPHLKEQHGSVES